MWSTVESMGGGGSPPAESHLQKCTDAVINIEETAHWLQYSNEQVKFIEHFYFHPNCILSASSTFQIEVLLSIT